MRYTAEIIATGDSSMLYDSLLPEVKEAKRDRSEFNIHKIKEGVKIKVSAADSVALRATLNNITKLLEVYEKIG